MNVDDLYEVIEHKCNCGYRDTCGYDPEDDGEDDRQGCDHCPHCCECPGCTYAEFDRIQGRA